MECRLCGRQSINQAFTMGKQPLANKYPKDDNEIEVEHLYDMNVKFCTNCISCQVAVDIPREVFFQDYFYLSSVNKELVEHFENLAFELKDKQFVVDIGSNDGVLLKPLKSSMFAL